MSSKWNLLGNTKKFIKSQNEIFKILFHVESIFVFMRRFDSFEGKLAYDKQTTH